MNENELARKNLRFGWALFGLARSLRDRRRPREALAVERRFETAWSRADVSLQRTAL